MGRLSQLFWFLNAEEMPDAIEQKTVYTHLNITPKLKRLRAKFRKNIKKSKNAPQSQNSGKTGKGTYP